MYPALTAAKCAQKRPPSLLVLPVFKSHALNCFTAHVRRFAIDLTTSLSCLNTFNQ